MIKLANEDGKLAHSKFFSRVFGNSTLTTVEHEPAKGSRADDITAYEDQYHFCSRDRASRPKILLQFRTCQPRQGATPSKYLIYDDKVVLDYLDRPIVDFDGIPLTLSSKVEGWLLETMRRYNSKISWADIMARINRRGDSENITENRLSERTRRFRAVGRCVAWDHKKGSRALEDHLLSLMTAEMVAKKVAKNTTEGLDDIDGTNGEAKFIESLNLGTAAKNARKRAVSGEVKNREAKRQKNILKGSKNWIKAQLASE